MPVSRRQFFKLASGAAAAVALAGGSSQIVEAAASKADATLIPCDGATYLKSDFPELADALGPQWWPDDATFQVPNILVKFMDEAGSQPNKDVVLPDAGDDHFGMIYMVATRDTGPLKAGMVQMFFVPKTAA